MVGSIWLEGLISRKTQQDERAAMESATAIATEAVVSIRTVQSLGKIQYSVIVTNCICSGISHQQHS